MERDRRERNRGQALKVTLELTLDEVARGTTKTMRLRTLDRCTAFGGTGAEAASHPVSCETWGGAAEVRGAARSKFGRFASVSPLPTFPGERNVIPHPPSKCQAH